MGQEPGDIAREIKELRDETNVIVDELARRANLQYMARGVVSTVGSKAGEVAGVATHRVEDVTDTVRYRAGILADDVNRVMPERVRRNPSVVGGAALGLVASLGAFVVANLIREREQSTTEKAMQQVEHSTDRVRGGLDQLRHFVQQTRTELDKGRRVQIVVQKEEPSMMKRLAWVALVSVMGTLGGMLFQRLSAQFWRSAMHEEPPKK